MVMLEAKDIHIYYGQSHIIQGISFGVSKGEVVCLLGRNGAGKSTTIKSIVGWNPPRSGSICFKGQEISGEEPYNISRLGLGYVPEDRRIFPELTVLENLEVAIQPNRKGSWNITRVFDFFPDLKTLRNSKGMKLSGGEQQMLTIARALMGSPDLLILDEPSEGLAPLIVNVLHNLVVEIRKEITILLVEQNANFAINLSNRGYIIEKGKILYHGDVNDLRTNKDIVDRYLSI